MTHGLRYGGNCRPAGGQLDGGRDCLCRPFPPAACFIETLLLIPCTLKIFKETSIHFADGRHVLDVQVHGRLPRTPGRRAVRSPRREVAARTVAGRGVKAPPTR
jgi:hypothetical protein